MIGMCPYVCSNKSQSGYCRTTVCVNLSYKDEINRTNGLNKLYKSLLVYKPKDGEQE